MPVDELIANGYPPRVLKITRKWFPELAAVFDLIFVQDYHGRLTAEKLVEML